MSTMDKINKIAESKAAIKAAIEAKGVSDVGNVLSEYPAKIASIQTGGTSPAIDILISDGVLIDTRTIIDETVFDDNKILIDL